MFYESDYYFVPLSQTSIFHGRRWVSTNTTTKRSHRSIVGIAKISGMHKKTSSWYLRAITLNANVPNLSTTSSAISRFPPPWPLDIGWTNPFSNSTVSPKFCWLSSSQRHAGLENAIFVVGFAGEFLLSATLAKPFVLQQKAQSGGMDLAS